jgi:hypothetical protein
VTPKPDPNLYPISADNWKHNNSIAHMLINNNITTTGCTCWQTCPFHHHVMQLTTRP